MINNEKILVLGSNSFGGSSYINFALDKGYTVIGINRSKEQNSCFHPYKNNNNKNKYQSYNLHLIYDNKKIISILEKEKPQYIVDFAGQGMVAESWKDPILWFETNLISKIKIHEYLKNKNWLKKYIRISTPEVYGSNPDKVNENQNLNPTTPYAVSHAAVDMSLLSYFKNYNFPITIGRFANFYGPGQQIYRIIPKTILYAKSNKKLPLHGAGKSMRAFIFNDDVSMAIDKLITKGKIGEIYNFSPSDYVSIKELVVKILNIMKLPYESYVFETEDRISKDHSYFMDTKKAEQFLNWAPSVSLEDGINSTIRWVNNNYPILNEMPAIYQHKI